MGKVLRRYIVKDGKKYWIMYATSKSELQSSLKKHCIITPYYKFGRKNAKDKKL